MAQQKVELRKVRDFSDNLNDTFLFIRQNLKPLLTSFLTIAGIFMLIAAIISGLYQSDMGSVFEQIIRGRSTIEGSPFNFINTNYFLVILFTWMNVVAMQVVIISYMKYYDDNDGATPAADDVWKIFRSNFLLILVYSLVNAFIFAIGFVLCILPGIYLLVVLIPFPSIVILERQSYGAAFTRCFALIKENFWMSLGLYLLVYIIYSFSAGIISAIIGGITGVLFYFTTKNIGQTVGVITSILNIFSFVFYIIYYVSVVLNYFNLSERLDGTGMMRKLDTLGENEGGFDNIQEQY